MGQRMGQRGGNLVTPATRLDLREPDPWRMSGYFRRRRHTRKCQQCGSWLAVDRPLALLPLPWRGRPISYSGSPAASRASCFEVARE